MTEQLFEQLLYRGEGDALEFKAEQYAFSKFEDKKEGELLKDILALANAWRDTDAYIILGVKDRPGQKRELLGITEHLPEADLQQFVNGKTQRPMTFSYEVFHYQGKEFGIIHVPVQEQRPFYSLKQFGVVQAGAVHIRRGSSTDIADPDEIARMGTATVRQTLQPSLIVEVRSKLHSKGFFAEFHLVARVRNLGKVTAHDLTIIPVQQKIEEDFKTVWDLQRAAAGVQFVLRTPLHPGGEQTIAIWKIGVADMPDSVLEILDIQGEKMARESKQASSRTPRTELTLTVLARDMEPLRFNIVLSKAEIESDQIRTFSPTKGI